MSLSVTPYSVNHHYVYPEMLEKRVLFFTGYAGSGKGTQGKTLAEQWKITHLSTGELFRKEADKNTEIGLKMDAYMKRGEVIPKEIVFSYLEQELSKDEYKRGFILDGYPKSMEFYEHLMPLLEKLGLKPLVAIHFDISKETAVQRLTGRLHCGGCNRDFHKISLPPKVKDECDNCHQKLEERSDDTKDAIEKRLKVFDETTRPVVEKFNAAGFLRKIDASQVPQMVQYEIASIVNEAALRGLQESSSYFLRKPYGLENVSVYHNHIDAKSFEVLHAIIRRVESVSADFQNKVYPVSHLVLGPQVKDPEFATVYAALPNFHPIEGALEEAFSTGKMGDKGFNYEQILATLKAAFSHPGQGVMTELEEEIFSEDCDKAGNKAVLLDRGNTPDNIDWSQLPDWKEKMIASLPRFELHHGFNIDKKGEVNPPIDPSELSEITTSLGFKTGGFFIFRNENEWRYRSNEFFNGDYEKSLQLLKDQAVKLRTLVNQILPGRTFESNCSLEKVHAIWRVS